MLCLIVVEVPVFTTLRSWLCLIKDSLVAYRQKCGVPEDPLPPERLVEKESGIWHWNLEVEKILWLIPLGKVLSYHTSCYSGFLLSSPSPRTFLHFSTQRIVWKCRGPIITGLAILKFLDVASLRCWYHFPQLPLVAAFVFVHLSFNLITIATWYPFLMLQDASKKLFFALWSNWWFLQPESWKRKFGMLEFEMCFFLIK